MRSLLIAGALAASVTALSTHAPLTPSACTKACTPLYENCCLNKYGATCGILSTCNVLVIRAPTPGWCETNSAGICANWCDALGVLTIDEYTGLLDCGPNAVPS